MLVDVVSLEPAVHGILTAPGVDLSTISAKRVRKQLAAQNPDLTDDWIRDNKAALDALIAKVFTQLQPLAPEEQSEAGSSELHRSPQETEDMEDDDGAQEEEDDDLEEEEEEKKRPAKKPKKNKPLTDEEYAKQLSSEINGRTRSSRSGTSAPKRSRGVKTKGSRRNISAATVDSDDDGDGGVGKKRKKPSGGGGARGGFSKEYVLSEPLAVVIQVERLSRPQVVKKLWEYIKGNDLQNPSNKREIICDSSLRAVFGQDKIDMFKMNKVLGHHLT